MSPFVTFFGHRDTPQWALVMLKDCARILVDHRWGFRSGGADGVDSWAEEGARSSRHFNPMACQIFLPWKDFHRRKHDITNGVFDTSTFTATIQSKALDMAISARGNRGGLNAFGLRLMARNFYELFGPKLDHPSRMAVCYCETRNGKPRGGSGVTMKLSIQSKIDVVNLATETGKKRIEDFLARYNPK